MGGSGYHLYDVPAMYWLMNPECFVLVTTSLDVYPSLLTGDATMDMTWDL